MQRVETTAGDLVRVEVQARDARAGSLADGDQRPADPASDIGDFHARFEPQHLAHPFFVAVQGVGQAVSGRCGEKWKGNPQAYS